MERSEQERGVERSEQERGVERSEQEREAKSVDVPLVRSGRVVGNIKRDSSSATRLSGSNPATWDRMPKVPHPFRRECGLGSLSRRNKVSGKTGRRGAAEGTGPETNYARSRLPPASLRSSRSFCAGPSRVGCLAPR